MTLNVNRLPGNFGAAIEDFDVRHIDDVGLRYMYSALYNHRFLVVRNQSLSHDDYVGFARRWGRPVELIARHNVLEQHPEIIVQSNSAATPPFVRNVANHWHCDSSYEAEVASVTMLYGIEAPERDGVTLFADLVAAYDAMPVTVQRRCDMLRVRHATAAAEMLPDEQISRPQDAPEDVRRTIVRLDPVTHPLVQVHPCGGRKAYYGLGGSAFAIEGLPPEEGGALILDLRRHATRPRFCADYKLMPGDVLIWDNLSVMHRATPIEYSDAPGHRRLNYRISLKGLPPILEGEESVVHPIAEEAGHA